MNLGFYITDASFDYGTKTTTIGIVDIHNKKNYKKMASAGNPSDAETLGIIEALKIAFLNKDKNVIIVCDNKNSIKRIKEKIRNGEIGYQFSYLQFLWLPREYTQIADFFSKHLDEEHLEEYLKMKEAGKREMKEVKNNKIQNRFVNDIEYEKNYENDALDRRFKELIVLTSINGIESSKYESQAIKNILEGKRVEEIELSFLEGIESFENDIKNERNALIKICLELIKHLLISN